MSEAQTAIEVRGLTRRYKKITAVEDLDLTVQVGDVYGFLGPNGAGKTTAMRCMLGLIHRDAGDVRIFGTGDPVRARASVGAMIETPAFHDWMNARDNLREQLFYLDFPRKQMAAEIDRVLERVGLTGRARDRVRGYSLGMRQRLGFARALLGGPKLLLLDEPTNGLDPHGMRDVHQLVRTLARDDGVTVFVSSHLLDGVQAMCNRVGIIQDGRLRAEGALEELSARLGAGLQVEVTTPHREALERVVADLPGCLVTDGRSARSVRVTLDGIDVAELNRRLVAGGVDVEALVPSKLTLEDVFMKVTA